MIISEKLKTLRMSHAYTQEDLAEKLSVSRQSISKWETGVSIPDTEYILKLANLYNISTDELLGHKHYLDKKYFKLDVAMMMIGFIGFIIFGILIFTQRIDETSSVITLNAYGIYALLCLVIVIVSVIIMIVKYVKK